MSTLRELREKKVLSQKHLAMLSGVATSTISKIENGQKKPRFVTIHKLAEALGVEPGEIEF